MRVIRAVAAPKIGVIVCSVARCWSVVTKYKVTVVITLVRDSLVLRQHEFVTILVLAQVTARSLLFVRVVTAHGLLRLMKIHPALRQGLCVV